MSRSDSNGRNPQDAAARENLADGREAATEVDRAIGDVLRAMTHLDEGASDPARMIAALRARSESKPPAPAQTTSSSGIGAIGVTGAAGVTGVTGVTGVPSISGSSIRRMWGTNHVPARAFALAAAALILLAAGGAALWRSTRPAASGEGQDAAHLARNAAPAPQSARSAQSPEEWPQPPQPPQQAARPESPEPRVNAPAPASTQSAPDRQSLQAQALDEGTRPPETVSPGVLSPRAPGALPPQGLSPRTLERQAVAQRAAVSGTTPPIASAASRASAGAARLALGEPIEEIAVAAIDPTPLDAADAVAAPQLATDVIATEPIRVASVDAPTTPRSH